MIPRATYRLQFGKSFGFAEAAKLAPYLASLGVSHVYASPYLAARPGSTHGYDVTNHNALNAGLGSLTAFHEMLSAFRAHGLAHILDYVPNHMGVGGADNPIWLDVLEWGRDSRYASWFDIDWDSHSEYLKGKLLVPFLAHQYGTELQSGALQLKFDPDDGGFSVWLYDTHKLPVTPPSYPHILRHEHQLQKFAQRFAELGDSSTPSQDRARALKTELARSVAHHAEISEALHRATASFQGVHGELTTWDALDSLVVLQHWRPTHFRVAADDINYRRFFNISELAAICMERPEVFEHTHKLVLELLKSGDLDGLRIDHIDGLYDPKCYLEQLRQVASVPFYLVVEKILGRHESLRPDWPVHGTTGYDFCAQATALLVNSRAEEPLTEFYQAFSGENEPFPEIVRDCKRKILENELGSELETLARDAVRVARLDPCTTDFTRNILRRALKEIIACFPVYRTYVHGGPLVETDDHFVHWAVASAAANEPELDQSVFDFLEQLLTGRLAQHASDKSHRDASIRCAMKAQQLSGPVMAKGFEDTALYRYNRFLALNDVGSSPDEFGISVSAFHKANLHRAAHWPQGMLGTSTHDTKHGEDARARLAAVSLFPDEWTAKVSAWSRILRARHSDVEGNAPPSHNDEYAFFQNLIATWPAELTLPNPLNPVAQRQYSERLQAAMLKTVREARVHSNWNSPNESYEQTLKEFVRDALNSEFGLTFLELFLPFQQKIAEMGVKNSLVQLLLKVVSPGVPDFYQGSELWDFSLPDPDNRKSIDFATRQTLLARAQGQASDANSSASFRILLEKWHDGAVKLALTHSLLHFRRANPQLFEAGEYIPMATTSEAPMRICAFSRRLAHQSVLAVASLDPRLHARDFADVSLALPADELSVRWRDVISGAEIRLLEAGLPLSQVFSTLPVALLTPIS